MVAIKLIELIDQLIDWLNGLQYCILIITAKLTFIGHLASRLPVC